MVIFEVTDYPRHGSIEYNKKYYGFNEILVENKTAIMYGYLHNNSLVNFKFNSPFMWKVDIPQNKNCSYKELAHTDAEQIIHSYRNVVLCVSGGIDSEFMLQSFLPFSNNIRVVFFDYKFNVEDKNDISTKQIYKNFKIEFIKIDAENFFLNNLDLIYGFKYRTSFPEAMLFLYALDQIKESDTCYVLSGDIPEPVLINNSLNFSFVSDNICAIDRWAAINNVPVCSSFLLNNKDKTYAVTSALSSPKYLNFKYNSKQKLYQELGYTVELRDKKYTGLENLRKSQNIWKYSAIIEKFKKIEFDGTVNLFLNSHHQLLE